MKQICPYDGVICHTCSKPSFDTMSKLHCRRILGIEATAITGISTSITRDIARLKKELKP